LLNAVGGVLRVLTRSRSNGPVQVTPVRAQVPATGVPAALRLHRRVIRLARHFVELGTALPASRPAAGAATSIPNRRTRRWQVRRRQLLLALMSERAIPVAIAVVVLLAAAVSLAPAAQPVGAVQGNTTALRLTVGGYDNAGGPAPEESTFYATPDPSGFPEDATLYKPVAVDTSIQSSTDLLQHYTVAAGDTLTGIANRFGVSMMTLWWANHLTAKDSLHVGESLVVPPVNGLVVTVQVGDTLDSLAAKYKVDAGQIVAENGLEDTTLIVGQVLVLPGAKGAPMPTPTPAPVRVVSTGTGKAPPYTGGKWAWPVAGSYYISQYFHYGHYAIDIAANYGTPIVAPLAGTVVFAGWNNNGGGYQVWISHGNNLYTGSHHMSAVTVSVGQTVARGQQIGRVGQSGWATGPHDHFEVWIGYPWKSGSYRVNPLRYY
jgi:murein DD-endopeptidase MepM/ murein hydrolase activator NlpD